MHKPRAAHGACLTVANCDLVSLTFLRVFFWIGMFKAAGMSFKSMHFQFLKTLGAKITENHTAGRYLRS